MAPAVASSTTISGRPPACTSKDGFGFVDTMPSPYEHYVALPGEVAQKHRPLPWRGSGYFCHSRWFARPTTCVTLLDPASNPIMTLDDASHRAGWRVPTC